MQNWDLIWGIFVLQRYQRKRYLDVHSMVGFTDGIVRIFSNDFPMLRHTPTCVTGMPACAILKKRLISARYGRCLGPGYDLGQHLR